MRDVMGRTADALRPEAEKKGLLLDVQVDTQVPALVQGDGVRLFQVLTNLLGNAVKFTERGRIVLRAGTSPSIDPEQVKLAFSVSDTGIGIPKSQQEDLFTAFTQVDDTLSRSHGRTGLGLAISKQIVELMGGTLSVESRPEYGSVFSLLGQFQALRRPSIG